MPIHEIITFKPSKALLADPNTTLHAASKFFSTVDGCSGLYYGASEEEENTAFIVIVWETYEHHKAVIDSPGYPGIVGLKDAFGGESKMLHVNFIEKPDAAMDSGTTEVLNMTLKEGKAKADLAGVISGLGPKITAEEGCTKPLAWGETKEEPENTFFLFLGWTTSKRHFEVVGQESYAPLIGNLFATVDIKMLHTTFRKFA